MQRQLRVLIMVLAVLGLLVGPINPALAAGKNTPRDIPAPLPGGSPTASAYLSPTSGYITQAITVTGQTSAPAPSVRIMWIYGDGLQTVTAAVANTNGNSYSSQVSVPLDAQPAPRRCAPQSPIQLRRSSPAPTSR